MAKVNSLTIVDESPLIAPRDITLSDIPIGQLFQARVHYGSKESLYLKFAGGVLDLKDPTIWYSLYDTTFCNYIPRTAQLTLK